MLLLLTLSSGAKAQLVWKQSIPRIDGQLQNKIFATSSYGNTIYVVGKVFDNATKESGIRFFRTEDGGKSWKVQDPKVNVFLDKWLRSYRLQQIDSLNIVSIVDSGIIIRTFDGGESWHIQNIDEEYYPNSVHFYDSLQGIITVGGLDDVVFTTIDGGRTWQKKKTFSDRGLNNCYSYGNGKYTVFSPTNINFFTTSNDWVNIKPSNEIINQNEDSTYLNYIFNKGKFTATDVVFTFGKYTYNGTGLLARSTDIGQTWGKPVHFFYNPVALTHMSDANRDTIYASGLCGDGLDLMCISTDNGNAWRVDTLHSQFDVIGVEVFGVEIDGLGRAIIASDLGVFYGEDTSKLGIEAGYKIRYYSYIYPNPASSEVRIETFLASKDIQLIDILGRTVLSGFTKPDGKIKFDISTLPRGVYGVLLRRQEGLVTIGKVAVTGGGY